MAVINDKLENVRVLIEAEADLNAPDEFSNVFNTAVSKRMHAIDGNGSCVTKEYIATVFV